MVMSVIPSVVSIANPSIASKLAPYFLATVASFFGVEAPSTEQSFQFDVVDTSQNEGGSLDHTDAQMRKGLGGGGEPTAPSARAKGKSSSKDVVDRGGSQEGTDPYEKQSQSPQGYSQAGPELTQPIPLEAQAGTDPDDAPQHTGRGSSSGDERSSRRHKSDEIETPSSAAPRSSGGGGVGGGGGTSSGGGSAGEQAQEKKPSDRASLSPKELEEYRDYLSRKRQGHAPFADGQHPDYNPANAAPPKRFTEEDLKRALDQIVNSGRSSQANTGSSSQTRTGSSSQTSPTQTSSQQTQDSGSSSVPPAPPPPPPFSLDDILGNSSAASQPNSTAQGEGTTSRQTPTSSAPKKREAKKETRYVDPAKGSSSPTSSKSPEASSSRNVTSPTNTQVAPINENLTATPEVQNAATRIGFNLDTRYTTLEDAEGAVTVAGRKLTYKLGNQVELLCDEADRLGGVENLSPDKRKQLSELQKSIDLINQFEREVRSYLKDLFVITKKGLIDDSEGREAAFAKRATDREDESYKSKTIQELQTDFDVLEDQLDLLNAEYLHAATDPDRLSFRERPIDLVDSERKECSERFEKTRRWLNTKKSEISSPSKLTSPASGSRFKPSKVDPEEQLRRIAETKRLFLEEHSGLEDFFDLLPSAQQQYFSTWTYRVEYDPTTLKRVKPAEKQPNKTYIHQEIPIVEVLQLLDSTQRQNFFNYINGKRPSDRATSLKDLVFLDTYAKYKFPNMRITTDKTPEEIKMAREQARKKFEADSERKKQERLKTGSVSKQRDFYKDEPIMGTQRRPVGTSKNRDKDEIVK